jgi:hypothetical protein
MARGICRQDALLGAYRGLDVEDRDPVGYPTSAHRIRAAPALAISIDYMVLT